jgi:hypothetical protein
MAKELLQLCRDVYVLDLRFTSATRYDIVIKYRWYG